MVRWAETPGVLEHGGGEAHFETLVGPSGTDNPTWGYPKFILKNQYPTFRVPENSGLSSGLPEIPDKKPA